MSKPEQKPMLNPPKRTRSPMPADLQAANRIDQILNALSLEDAELVLDRANLMLAKRKAAIANPPHAPE